MGDGAPSKSSQLGSQLQSVHVLKQSRRSQGTTAQSVHVPEQSRSSKHTTAQRRVNMDPSGAAHHVPPLDVKESRVFHPGDKVNYWSKSRNVWMETRVIRAVLDLQGKRVIAYDLTSKLNACAGSVRGLHPAP